jgi:hypothetical protein
MCNCPGIVWIRHRAVPRLTTRRPCPAGHVGTGGAQRGGRKFPEAESGGPAGTIPFTVVWGTIMRVPLGPATPTDTADEHGLAERAR